jgi:hypothetical protein
MRMARNTPPVLPDESTPAGKIFLFPKDGNYDLTKPSRASQEGRFAIATTRGAGCDGRVGAAWRAAPRVRSSRVVLAPRRWSQPPGRRARGMVANKPGTPGRARSSRKAIAQGVPVVSALPDYLVCVSLFAHKPADAASARHSLRPLFSRERRDCITRTRNRAAGTRRCVLRCRRPA